MLMFEFRMQMKNEQCQPKNNSSNSVLRTKVSTSYNPVLGLDGKQF